MTRDTFGSEVVSWIDVDRVWADVRQTGASEKYDNEAEREVGTRNAAIRIRFRNDVDESMRLLYDGLNWDIEGINELGYRRFLLLTCETDVDRPDTSYEPLAAGAFGPAFGASFSVVGR